MDFKPPNIKEKPITDNLYTFLKITYNKNLKQYICCLTTKSFPKPVYITLEKLPEESQEKIKNFTKTVLPLPIKSTPDIKPIMKKTINLIEDEDEESSQSNSESLLKTMCDLYHKGNYLFDKPVKIIGVHGNDALFFSVLYSCKNNMRNIGLVSYQIIIESYPELLMKFLEESKIVLTNRTLQDIKF
ncbi:hypothetical protein SteCoe_32862 [Stentor coeruleus]|uniref:Uncharacterized protein n=1 Tax=Stentor coeruleus TaxID=5963 RepID=A0A1R2AYH9_9CILI|nr:hypothetical protein SteCoe_32862 [Stentor coeruleus]